MKDLEKYYGIKMDKKMSLTRFLKRSNRYKAKQAADSMLREVNMLFVKGNYEQCFALLEDVVKLVPSDPRPFYTLGLIHEEMQNNDKAHISYFMSALLKKGDCSLWKKVLSTSTIVNDDKKQAIALEKIYRREPSQGLLYKKMECFRKMNKKYWVIGCEIELFDYVGVNETIFDRFKDTYHLITIKRITDRLMRCILKNESARTEYFIRNTIFNFYKIKDWDSILLLLNDYYSNILKEFNSEIHIISLLAKLNIHYNMLRGKENDRPRDEKHNNSCNCRNCNNRNNLTNLNNRSLNNPQDTHLGSYGYSCQNLVDFRGNHAELSKNNTNDCKFDISGLEDVFYGLKANILDSFGDHINQLDLENTSDDQWKPKEMIINSEESSECIINENILSSETINNGDINIFMMIEELLESCVFWEKLSDTKYVVDMVNFLVEYDALHLSIELLRKLSAKDDSLEIKIMIANLYVQIGDFQMAKEFYLQILKEDPTNMRIKSSLHEIYTTQGDHELAKELEMTTQAYKFIESIEDSCKKDHRYSYDRCRETRKIFEKSKSALDQGYREYLECTEPLLTDFSATLL